MVIVQRLFTLDLKPIKIAFLIMILKPHFVPYITLYLYLYGNKYYIWRDNTPCFMIKKVYMMIMYKICSPENCVPRFYIQRYQFNNFSQILKFDQTHFHDIKYLKYLRTLSRTFKFSLKTLTQHFEYKRFHRKSYS